MRICANTGRLWPSDAESVAGLAGIVGANPTAPSPRMKTSRLLPLLAAALLAAGLPRPLVATNGMNMEGYGPIATALGGASFAYDNGTAGLINNPATLG